MSQKTRSNKKTELGHNVRTTRGAGGTKDTPPPAPPARRRTLEVVDSQPKEAMAIVPVKRAYPQRPVRAVAGKGARKRGLRQ